MKQGSRIKVIVIDETNSETDNKPGPASEATRRFLRELQEKEKRLLELKEEYSKQQGDNCDNKRNGRVTKIE